jgi:hypothetical protein
VRVCCTDSLPPCCTSNGLSGDWADLIPRLQRTKSSGRAGAANSNLPPQLIANLLSLLDSTGRVLRVVLEPLLDRFVSYKEPKPPRCIRVSCALHIEVPERHGVRHGLRSAFFDRDEVELIVDTPVVRHHVRRAVLEHQLRVARRAREDERVRWHWRQRVRWHWRDEIPHRIRKRSGDAVSKEYRRTRCELHDNHSAPYSCQWRLREGCSIRNEQSEKRETNCATHASPPARITYDANLPRPQEKEGSF